MTEYSSSEDARVQQSASLSDLEQLWGDGGLRAFSDESTRERYLETECPLPSLADEQIWQQPLCA
ncbi:hypothetical protein EKD04_021520 [Chloroflexales bacterium ZM16-3]|nr:hypothetical protein [Chloroflexales bacterium ZM16-3]